MYLSFSGIPQTDEKDELHAGILFIKDITSDINISYQLEQFDINHRSEYLAAFDNEQKQLNKDRELLQSIIDTIPVMVTVYDNEVNSIALNKAATEITGWTNEDVAQTGIMELAYPDPAYRKKIVEYMQSLKSGFKDIVMRTKDGRDIETSWANVELSDGRRVGVGIDITQRKQLEKELIIARKKAEKENQVQYAFIQNISHEVRTPMNSILGYTELLRKMINGTKELEFIDAISYNGEQLLRLINDIMDFSRLDKSELSLEKEEVSVKYLVSQSRKQFVGMKETFKKNNLKLSVKSAHKLNKLMLYTDLHRLQQILTNLLSNAVKYTEKGYVELGVNIRENEKDLLFYVKDTGIGICKEDHPRVFSRFNRFHNTAETEFRGTGLGLAICKHLVSLLGGDMWFESEPGKGSTFYFTHPIEEFQLRVESVNTEGPVKNYETPDLDGYNILIAEDDSFSYMLMYHMLTETKAKIFHADTGKKAVEIFSQNKIDLAFLDIRLPEMDGYAVIREIKKMKPSVPVIAQTANVLPEDKKNIKRSGFHYHASKPINQNELYSVINRFINKK